jgi:hypothetical protein
VGNATWSTTDGGPTCNCIPITSSVVYINPAHTVTVTAPATADFITVLNGATLNGTSTLTSNYDITTQGTGTVSPSAGTWTINRNLTVGGTSSSTSGASLLIGGTLWVKSANTLTMANSVSVAENLIIDGTLALGNNTLTLSGLTKNISGSGGAATISGNGTVSISQNKNILNGAAIIINPTISLAANTTITNNGTITNTSNITGAAATSIWTNSTNGVLNVEGAILATGVLNASAAPNTFNYRGSGAQTIKQPSSSYYNLTISNAGTKVLANNISVTNNVTIQNAAALNVGTNSLSGTAGLTMTGTSDLQIGRTTNATYPELSGAYSLTGGTVTFNQTSGTYDIREVIYYNVYLNGSGASIYDFNNGVEITNNLTVALAGTARIRNIDAALTIGNDFIFNSSSSNASTLSNDLTVGTFTLTGGLVNAGTFIFEIANPGGWTHNGGTFTPASGTVLFSGSANQVIGGSVASTLSNLEISNTGPSGVQLNQDLTVTGTLTLTEGFLTTSTTNILSMASGSSVSGVSNESFVNGPMEKVGSTNFTFPVGKDAVYRPIGISTLGSSGTYRAEYFHASANGTYNLSQKDGSLDHVGAGEYWQLQRMAGPSTSAFITLSWDSYSGIVDNLANLRVAGWDGTTWKNLAGTGTGSVTPGTGTIITAATVTTFGPFTLASSTSANPLPITLIEFTAELNEQEVLVKWKTATEVNNDFFTIEKTKDGKKFLLVKTVKGTGTSNNVKSYKIIDSQPFPGISYYRLKQTDFDGAHTYSKLVAISNSSLDVPSCHIFPNPTIGNNLNVLLSGYDAGETINVEIKDERSYTIFHQKLQANDTGGCFYSIDISEFAQGLYIIFLNSTYVSQKYKVVFN